MRRCRHLVREVRPEVMTNNTTNIATNIATKVTTFYKFARVTGPTRLESLRRELLERAGELELKGTILLANEGINGTLSGNRAALDLFVEVLRQRASAKSAGRSRTEFCNGLTRPPVSPRPLHGRPSQPTPEP